MSHPAFFDRVGTIALFDPLAEFLGAAEAGRMEYAYADAVRLAGHSCPTVAGAWLMTRRALERLYPGALPERGRLRVDFRDAADSGVTGVIANVVALITGATQDTGFKGIGGRFDRRGLLYFGADIVGDVRFQRLDSGAVVEARYYPGHVPNVPAMQELLPKVLAGLADDRERIRFGELWQDRVRRILLEHADDDELVALTTSGI